MNDNKENLNYDFGFENQVNYENTENNSTSTNHYSDLDSSEFLSQDLFSIPNNVQTESNYMDINEQPTIIDNYMSQPETKESEIQPTIMDNYMSQSETKEPEIQPVIIDNYMNQLEKKE